MGALTGDFDAALQISGGTLDRLAATMHQNGFTNDAFPSLPHVVYFRLGGGVSPDNHRGSVAAQVGTPHVVLIDGATDRFWVEIGFRARYRADPGSTPLADVIHGTIRAMYRLETVDKSCPGWSKIAGDYIWLRVLQSSVSFEGSAYDESTGVARLAQPDEERVRQHISRHLANLLATQFQPKPHRVGTQFRRLITRATARSSGVAVPIGLDGRDPAGNVNTIQQVFLDGHDFAVGVSADYIVKTVQSKAATVEGRQVNIFHRRDAGLGGGLSIDYHFRIDTVTTHWAGAIQLIPGGLLWIRAEGIGWASRLYQSGVYNIESFHAKDMRMTASIEQALLLQFDATDAKLMVSGFGPPTVNIKYGGPFATEVVQGARAEVSKYVAAELKPMLDAAQTQLETLDIPHKKTALVEQLTYIDAAADADFDGASFNPNGVVLKGSIRLTPRHVPRASFEKSPQADRFDAIESWIPGGRVDGFEWSWHWFANPTQPPGAVAATRSETDSFQLRRPHGSRTRFGLAREVDRPLPGLDGTGKVCLYVTGRQVDHITGAWVPVRSAIDCEQFGYEFRIPMEMAPYFRIRDPRVTEVGLMHCAAPEDSTECPNTLVLYLPEELDDDVLTALVTGVNDSRRQYAGLLVLMLFPDGAPDGRGADVAGRIGRLTADLSAPVLVADDVRNRWSHYLGFATSTSWRLLSPTGVVSWAHDGHLGAPELTAVLDERLVPSRPAEPMHIQSHLRIGERISFDLTNGDCPPVPRNRPDTFGSRIGFLNDGQELSTTLQTLREAEQEDAELPWAAIVIDGVAEDNARRLMHELGFDIPILADPDGAITRRFGVRFTPSVMTLNSAGQLISHATGPFSDADPRPTSEE